MDYLENYTEIRVIGKGSYGEAVLVRRKLTGQYFISKKILTGLLVEKELTRVKQEALLMQRFSHPCIVTYVESFELDERIVIVMEYCPGGDLDQLIKKHKEIGSYFPEDSIKDWLAQLASALSHVHSLKIIHRDIKPSNIFLTYDGRLKLGDFGVSKALEHTNDSALTLVGTPLYMSPEVCNSLPYTYKSDIWSLGCVLYELCTFTKPFIGNNFIDLASKILQTDPLSIPSLYSSGLSEIISKLLSKPAEDRPSARKLLQDLGMEDVYSEKSKENSKILEWSAENIDFTESNTVSNAYDDDFESSSLKEASDIYEDDFESY